MESVQNGSGDVKLSLTWSEENMAIRLKEGETLQGTEASGQIVNEHGVVVGAVLNGKVFRASGRAANDVETVSSKMLMRNDKNGMQVNLVRITTPKGETRHEIQTRKVFRLSDEQIAEGKYADTRFTHDGTTWAYGRGGANHTSEEVSSLIGAFQSLLSKIPSEE